MPRDELPFQLEQNDRYSLKPRLRLRKARIVLAGKQCERPQADAIAGFQQTMLSYCRHPRTTAAMHTGLPAAEPIQRISWLPHSMSTAW